MKKLLCFMLAVLLLLSLCACGTEQENDKKESDAEDYIDIADDAKADGDFETAETNYKKALEQDDENGQLYLDLVDVYIRQYKFIEAYDLLLEGKEKAKNTAGIQDKLLDFNPANVVTDSDDLIRGRTSFALEGKWYHTYSYDQSGTLTGVTHYEDRNEINHIDFTYNSQDKLTTYYAYYTDGRIEKLDFQYNSVGNLTHITEYQTDCTTISGYTLIEYDDKNRKTKETKNHADGSNEWEIVYNYVSDSSIVVNGYKAGVSQGTKEVTLDEDGRTVKTSSRGYFFSEIQFDVKYGGDSVRKELISEENWLTRYVCYGQTLYPNE